MAIKYKIIQKTSSFYEFKGKKISKGSEKAINFIKDKNIVIKNKDIVL